MVDKFATDAIEECLMAKLASIFCPQTVLEMDDAVTEDIAGETEESKMERASSSQKLKVLQAALSALRRLDKHKPKGKSRCPIHCEGVADSPRRFPGTEEQGEIWQWS